MYKISTKGDDRVAEQQSSIPNSYIKTQWRNDITPLNAENMNKIEEGIDYNRQLTQINAADITTNANNIEDNREKILEHKQDNNNPHNVTASQVSYSPNYNDDGNEVQSALHKHRTDINKNTKDISDETDTRKSEDTRVLDESKTYTNNEITGLELSIEKKSNVDYIILKNKSGTEVASINASTFVKDGMLSNAQYNATTNKLTLTWNTDSGKSNTEVNLNDLVDIYIGGEGINVSSAGTISVDTDVVALKSDLVASNGYTPITSEVIRLYDMEEGNYEVLQNTTLALTEWNYAVNLTKGDRIHIIKDVSVIDDLETTTYRCYYLNRYGDSEYTILGCECSTVNGTKYDYTIYSLPTMSQFDTVCDYVEELYNKVNDEILSSTSPLSYLGEEVSLTPHSSGYRTEGCEFSVTIPYGINPNFIAELWWDYNCEGIMCDYGDITLNHHYIGANTLAENRVSHYVGELTVYKTSSLDKPLKTIVDLQVVDTQYDADNKITTLRFKINIGRVIDVNNQVHQLHIVGLRLS